MTDQEILQKAFEKVSERGYFGAGENVREWNIHESGVNNHWILCLPDRKTKTKNHYNVEAVIFDHGFAKFFWDSQSCCHNGDLYRHPAKSCFSKKAQYEWQYHLQQMVLEENPIKYLEKFL